MVVGGRDDRRNYQNDSQLSSLTRSCSNLQNYPIAMSRATGAIVSGHPIFPLSTNSLSTIPGIVRFQIPSSKLYGFPDIVRFSKEFPELATDLLIKISS